jgi:hypothetical protein
MHSDIREPNAGKCPKCGMSLVPEGSRFGFVRHTLGNPRHLLLMAAIMAAVMGAAMMMMR